MVLLLLLGSLLLRQVADRDGLVHHLHAKRKLLLLLVVVVVAAAVCLLLVQLS